MNNGKFKVSKDSVRISSLEECYFEGVYKYRFINRIDGEYIELESKDLSILCKKVDFAKGGITKNLFSNLVDTINLNSNKCVFNRQVILGKCKNSVY